MKKALVAVIVLLSLIFSTQAIASAGKSYFGVNFSMAEADLGTDLDLGVAALGVGTYLNDNFAIEGRLGFGIDDDTVSDSSGSLTMDLDYMFGAYIRAEAPLEKIRPYLILGYTHAEVEFSGVILVPALGPFSVSDDESDFSYGFGADFLVGDNIGVNAEYMKLIDTSDVEVEAVSLGAKFYF